MDASISVLLGSVSSFDPRVGDSSWASYPMFRGHGFSEGQNGSGGLSMT